MLREMGGRQERRKTGRRKQVTFGGRKRLSDETMKKLQAAPHP